ncbi:MAG: hypothetical protein DRI94_11120 [Bacteroidetes bacterium]|nr:MAG: hypothetical protein DRI94_11120 [Bacteroidota bacterium]
MNLKNRILNFAFKKQKFIEGVVIFLIFLGVSFKFSQTETIWVWADYPYFALIIAGLSAFLIIIWLRIEKHKIRETIQLIQQTKNTSDNYNLLTNRQQQVFDLIILNKSNKEICNELFIELSTLKTHINKIYKTMHVKSRKELKNTKDYK